jgi:hypothetical protein
VHIIDESQNPQWREWPGRWFHKGNQVAVRCISITDEYCTKIRTPRSVRRRAFPAFVHLDLCRKPSKILPWERGVGRGESCHNRLQAMK